MSLAGKFIDATSDIQGAHPGAHVHVGTVSGHAPADAIIIPDAHLLFTGDFKRAGVDLVVSGDGHEVVLHDYFKGEKRAALASPDGAHLTGDIINALTGHTQFAQADGSASVAQVIGHVTKLAGTATVIRNGVSIILNQGDNVNKGDVVASGSDSTLGITFIDGTVFGLASNAKMVLNEMIYDPNGSDNKSLISLVQGTISFVAGATAKHGDMKVDTPVATMGIRGTAVLVEIDFTVPANGSAPPAKFQVLVEPDGTTGSYILFDKTTLTPIATVNQAGTQTIVNGQGGVNFLSSAQLSADAQKIITDVFALKFSDLNNPNTKTATNFTDTIVPETLFLKTLAGEIVPVTVQTVNVADKAADISKGATPGGRDHIPGPPDVVTHNGATTEHILTTGSAAIDSVTGTVAYSDINPGDVPTVKTAFTSFTYQNAGHTDVTATLTGEQVTAIKAVETPLVVVQDPTSLNHGTAHWTYSIADNAFDFLAAGEVLTLTYTAHVDNNFAPSNEFKEATFTITITGTNDVPTITTSGNTITELVGSGNTATDTATGTVTFTDVDLTDRPIVSAALSTTHPFQYLDAHGNDITSSLTPQQLAAIAAVESPLTVVQGTGNTHNGSATWTYSVIDSAFDFLAKGEILTLNYVAQVDDGHGGIISTPITVSINGADVSVTGTNDVPTIVPAATTATATMTEDAAATLAANGTITFDDLDLTDTHTAVFVLKSSDASANLPGYSEAAPLSHIGTFALTAITESPAISTTGSVGWSFTLNDNDPVLQSLAVNQSITQVYTVTITDNNGASVTQDVTVVIHGTNDAPVITSTAAAATGAVTEDANTPDLTASGTLQIQDLDLIDSHTATVAFSTSSSSAHLPGFNEGTTNIGTFTIDPTVSESTADTDNHATLGWHFTLNDNDPVLQSLAVNQSITQVYTVTFSDGHGGTTHQDVTVVIHGTNDAPVITSSAAAATGAVTEDANTPDLTASGTLQIQDLDLIDSHTATVAFSTSSSNAHLPGFTEGTTNIGTFTIDPTVTENAADTDNHATLGWHFTLNDSDPMLQSLAVNQSITQVYTVTFSDGHGGTTHQDVTVVIHGTNDAPVLAADLVDSHSITEQPGLTGAPDATVDMASGSLTFNDVDLTDTHAVSHDTPTYAWSGGPLTTTQTDALTAASTLALHETDSTGSGAGSVAFDYSAVDNSFDFLAAGETLTVTYNLTIADYSDGIANGTSSIQPVTITITGTNDAASIAATTAGSDTGTVMEDGTLTASGALTVTDVDHGENHFQTPSTLTGTYGSFTFNAGTGTWSYALNDAAPNVQALTGTDVVHDKLTVTSADGTASHVIDVTIHGTNDAATIAATTSGSDAGAVTEDGTLTASGALTVTDVDHGENHFQAPGTLTGIYGSFTFDAGTGLWGYTLNDGASNVQALTGAEVVHDKLTVTSVDGTASHVIDVTIHGTNDAATITATTAGSDSGTVTEDGTLMISGVLTVTDVDHGENHFQIPSTLTGIYGSFTFDAGTGLWGYTLNDGASNVQALTGAEVVHDKLTVTSADGTASHVIDVTIHGANDAPSIVGEMDAPAQAVMVAPPIAITVLAAGLTTNALGLNTETFNDQTVGHRTFDSAAIEAHFNGSGNSEVFDGTVDGVSAAPFFGPLPGAPDETNYLTVGGGGVETITFQSEQNAFGLYWGSVDSYNSISFYEGSQLVASYTGANVAPLFADGNQGSFASNGYVQFSGLADFNKVVLTSTSNAFELDNVSAGAIHSKLSASVSGTLSVHDADIGDTLTASVTETGTVQFTGANGSTDVPNGANVGPLTDSHGITFNTVQSNGGTAVLDWTYHPTDSNLDFLKAGDVLKLTFNAHVSDGHGQIASHALTVELDGANSATDTSAFKVIEGTTVNDTFNNVGGGATVFGNGGQDTFVFKPGFGSATIADFDANNDTIEISNSLFANFADVIAHAHPVNQDLVITDAASDSITLKGIAAGQLHASNFHLV